jgi:adenylylsulfate kinase|tara:strand:- start:2176 stop:2601 length:426 start_codon:yes stop_codon:yes gene_type:complete
LKILIFGLPGSGKSTLAEPFAKEIRGVWINADKVREKYNDWDFTIQGRIRQAQRMRFLADEVVKSGSIAVADFVCPTKQARIEFAPDYTVWMNTIEEGRYEDTNKLFEKPDHVDYHVSKWFNDTPAQLAQVLKRFREKKNV